MKEWRAHDLKLRYCYGALLQQGGTLLPEADSDRLIVGFWWLFVIVVVTTYSVGRDTMN